jgi:tetratricopeptide (TPR) repeat protein
MPDYTEAGSTHGAVFLSYASQDAEAAQRICETLRSSGVEVWFDQSDLAGGDAWDAKIRKQIKECALFVPIITPNTNARAEGYFRREWKQAVERTHDMADDVPFLFPIITGEVTEATARVPDKFREVQWTRLRLDETPAEVAAQITRLIAGGAPLPAVHGENEDNANARRKKDRRPVWLRYVWLVVGVAFAAYFLFGKIWPGSRATVPENDGTLPASALSGVPVSKSSPARELAKRAEALFDGPGDATSTNLGAAAALCERAETLDPTDAEIWALAARIDSTIFWMRFDASDEQRQRAQQAAAKAFALAPDSPSSRRAQAVVYAGVVGTSESIAEAEKILRELLRETPGDKGLSSELAAVLVRQGRVDEGVTLFEQAGDLVEEGWTYFATGRFAEANKVADRMLVRDRGAPALYLKAHVQLYGFEDPAAAQQTIGELPLSDAQTENGSSIILFVAYCLRDPEQMLRAMEAFPQNFLSKQGFYGPKRMWTGLAQEMAGHREAAEAEWAVALREVLDRLKDRPGDLDLLLSEALLQAQLGQPETAEKTYRLYLNLAGPGAADRMIFLNSWILLRLGRKEEAFASLSDGLKGKHPGWEIVHACARLCPVFDPLRGDPRFEKLLRDTRPPDAKPFGDPKSEENL